MLRSGTDITVIALWMGRESTRTAVVCLRAHLELKQRALGRAVPVDGQPGCYRPPGDITGSSTALVIQAAPSPVMVHLADVAGAAAGAAGLL